MAEQEDREMEHTISSALNSGDFHTALPLIEKLTNSQLSNLVLPDERTPLHYACQHGRMDVVERLITHYKYSIVSKGHTPLQSAAEHGQLATVKFIAQFIDANKHFDIIFDEKTPLHKACVKGKLELSHLREGLNCLSLALQNGHLNLVTYLASKIGLDTESKYYCSPMFQAALAGHLDVLMYLVNEKGADPHTTVEGGGFYGWSLVHAASHGGHLDMVKYLVNKKGCNVATVENFFKTSPAYLAAEGGHLDVLKYIMEESGAQVEDVGTFERKSLVHAACHRGHLDVVKYLVKRGCNVAGLDFLKRSPAYLAAEGGYLNVLKYLIEEKGVNVHFIIKNKNWLLSGRSLVHAACHGGHLDVVKYLVEEKGCDNAVALVDKGGDSPAYLAADGGHLDVLKYLIDERGVSPYFEHAVNTEKWTFIHIATSKGYFNMVKYLVEKKEFNVDILNGEKQSAAYLAAKGGHLDILKYLIEEKGVNVHIRLTDRFETLLYVASYKGHLDIVKYLVEHCGCVEDFDATIYSAVAYGHLEVVRYFTSIHHCNPPSIECVHYKRLLNHAVMKKRLKIANFFLEEMKFDPNNNVGSTSPLHVACKFGRTAFSKYLMDVHNYDPLCPDKNNYTPLDLAVVHQNRMLEIVKCIPDNHQCDSDVLCIHFKTSLHLAVIMGKLIVVKHFIERLKCAPDMRDIEGRTLLHNASLTGHFDIVRYLVEEQNCHPISCLDNARNTPIDLALRRSHHCSSISEYCTFTVEKSSYDITVELHNQGSFIWLNESHSIINYLGFILSEIPLKVFIIGNSGAGKSTLVKALISKKDTLKGRIMKVKGVIPLTAGIVPITSHTQKLTIYDFAGHEEYYASHEMILQQTTQPLILLTVNTSLSTGEIKNQVQYWLSIISNAASDKNTMHVMIIGSHADKVNKKVRENISQLITSLLSNETSISYHGFICCDCRYSVSSKMNQLLQALDTTCIKIRGNIPLDMGKDFLHYNLLYKYLNRDLPHEITITLLDLYDKIRNSENALSQLNINELFEICKKLSSSGKIIFLPHDQNEEESLLITNENVIFERVHGSLKVIKESLDNDYGIVEGGKLETIASSVLKDVMDPGFVIKYLLFAQFCSEVTSNQLLSKQHPNYQDVYYFFPNLVLASRPGNILKSELESEFSKLYIWCLKCTNARQFFTPRCLHTLFIQLVKCERDTCNTEFVIWKNGILLVHSNGTRSIIEVTDQTMRLYLVMQCKKKSEMSLVEQRSMLISLIKSLVSKVCHEVEVTECLLHPQAPCSPNVTLDNFYSSCSEIPIAKVARSVVSSFPYVVLASKESVPQQISLLDDLLYFDSFHIIDESIVKEIFSKKDSDQVVSDFILSEIKAVNTNKKLQDSLRFSESTSQVTHRQLYTELHKYTIFPEGNLCELSGVELSSLHSSLHHDHQTLDFQEYVSTLPPPARPHLEYILDWGHDGVQRDLCEIADHMLDWEEKLSTHLGLADIDISDIKEENFKKPKLQRRAALKRWQEKQGPRATYRNLLKLFVDAAHIQCAEALCEVLRKKYSTPPLSTSDHAHLHLTPNESLNHAPSPPQ